MELKGSKTEANLQYAFAGESMARNKYTYFASVAKKEGFQQIAAIFEETAGNEKEHAKLWFKALNGIGTTAENLLAAAEGEHEEWTDMYKRFAEEAKEEGEAKVTQNLGPQDLLQGEELFGVCHICATFNDTFIHVTDLSGRETYARVTGGMKVKADREESSPYAAMLAAQDVYARLKQLGVTAIHIKMRGKGGSNTRALGPGAQTALRALARLGLKIGRIEDVTPIPTDSTRRAGGRRGRRL